MQIFFRNITLNHVMNMVHKLLSCTGFFFLGTHLVINIRAVEFCLHFFVFYFQCYFSSIWSYNLCCILGLSTDQAVQQSGIPDTSTIDHYSGYDQPDPESIRVPLHLAIFILFLCVCVCFCVSTIYSKNPITIHQI